MKKRTIVISSVLALLLTFGLFGLVYAQADVQPNPEAPYGRGRMGAGRGGVTGPAGMGGFRAQVPAGEEGPLLDYLLPVLADAFGLTPEELEARHEAGETLWYLAEAQEISAEQFQEIVLQARSEALNLAVAGGVITQEQADWMISRMSQGWAAGYGPGSVLCVGSGPVGAVRQARAMHWNAQP